MDRCNLSDFIIGKNQMRILREFTSEYYIPSALHPVVPAADASIADFPVGKVGVYTRRCGYRYPIRGELRLLACNPNCHLFRDFVLTCWSNGWVSVYIDNSSAPHPVRAYYALLLHRTKLACVRRWRGRWFFWVDDFVFPWYSSSFNEGLLPWDERHYPPGLVLFEDAELINENSIPFNALLGRPSLLATCGNSRNYFERRRGRGAQRLLAKSVGVGACPSFSSFSIVDGFCSPVVTFEYRRAHNGTRAGANPEIAEILCVDTHTSVVVVAKCNCGAPMPDATSIGFSEDADVAEVDSGLKRKRATVSRLLSDSSGPGWGENAALVPHPDWFQGLRWYCQGSAC
ncbi:hypothetical protein Tco_0615837 [Tanacetum coccineum]